VDIVPFYDFVLLDCPPRISLSSYAALCASDYVVIPLEAADWGARGTASVQAAVERVQEHDNPHLRLLGYVVSKFKRQRLFQMAYLAQIRETFGEDAFKTVIPDSAAFERSVDNAIPITLHSPSSHASRVARQLFDEFQARIARCRAQEKHPGISEPGGKSRPPAHSSALTR
jgi:chromosome partitioning protein